MYKDVYCYDLCANVEVSILDKKGFEKLQDYGLVLFSKDAKGCDWKMLQDELSYCYEDCYKNGFNYEIDKIGTDIVIKIYDDEDEDKLIMSYTVVPSFEE